MSPRWPTLFGAVPLVRDLALHRARRIALAAGVALLGLATYLFLKLAGGVEGGGAFAGRFLYAGVPIAAAGLCLTRAALVRRDRGAWAILGASALLWIAGDVHSELVGAAAPSLSDALWLAFYPGVALGVTLLGHRHVRALGRKVLYDGLVAALGLAALTVGLVLGPVLATADGDSLAIVTSLAYPAGDALLVVFVAGMFATFGRRPGGAWTMIGLSLLLFAAADINHLLAADGPHAKTLADGLYLAALVTLGLAAWQPPVRELHREGEEEGWGMLILPGALAASALGLLVYDHVGQVSDAAVALAAATIVVAGGRAALTLQEVRALSDSRRLAMTDDLTGLANRRQLYAALADVGAEPAALLLIDLDHFKEINDTLGHEAGDRLLEQVGDRLADVGLGGTLARLGGDEFAVLLPGYDADQALIAGAAVRQTLADPLSISGIAVRTEGSVGVAVLPPGGTDHSALLRQADIAMYEAKRRRTGVELYAPERDEHSRDRIALFGELRDAIADGQLVLHYQPQRQLRSGQVTMVEVLVRWEHPRRGLLSPDAFIPLAESTDLMRPLTIWVLERALDQLSVWRKSGLQIGAAVNISVANLLDLDFPAVVAARLAEADVPAEHLQLEITETVLMADPVRANEVLGELRAMGVRLSLDDFGTGYSSLAYLKNLPVEELKIDRSFVMNMGSDGLDAAIVRSTIELARNLGLQVVAEGVENAETLAELEHLGCDLVQGYFLSRPMPARELETWMHAASSAAEAAPPPPWQAALSPLRGTSPAAAGASR